MLKLKKYVSLCLAVVLIVSIASGCASNSQQAAPQSSSAAASSTAESTAAPETPQADALPLSPTPVTYKAFYAMNKAEYDPSNNAMLKDLAEKTNVNIEWECHIQGAGAAEAFNLMMTSGQYPDMIFSENVNFPGGYEAGIDDGILLDLQEMIPQYMPNYWAELSTKPEAMRDIRTPKGYIPGIYQFYKDLYLDQPSMLMGMEVRGDWLKDLNMEVPKTIDDWYVMLKAFKEEKNADFPLLIGPENGVEAIGIFLSAFGVYSAPGSYDPDHSLFYPGDDGKIKYGGLEQGYQEYLETFSKWYQEGLYDRDFTTRGPRDLPGRAALVANDKAGAVAMYVDWEGMFYSAAIDPDFELVTVPYPAKVAGEKQKVSLLNPKYTAYPLLITTSCKDPETLLKFWDYVSYGDGLIEKNYGLEGDDFTMVNGVPQFTDKLLKHDFGANDAAQIYTLNYYPIRLTHSESYIKQMQSSEMLEKKKVFIESCDPIYRAWSLTAEEGERLSQLMSEIRPYVTEQTARAIMDPSIASSWMSVHAEQLKKMGAEEAVAIVQGAYDRYMSRG